MKKIIPGAQVVHRVSALLRELAKKQESGARLVDLYKALDLEQPTAYRLMQALVIEGLAHQDTQSKKYFLGPLITELSMARKTHFDLQKIAFSSLERIASQTEDTVYLVTQSRYETVCIERLEGSYPVKVLTLDIGDRRPLGVNATGLSILSALENAQAREIIEANAKQYPKYNLTKEEVSQIVCQARNDKYVCVSIAPGTTTLGVPILGTDMQPVGAVAVAAIATRMEAKRRNEIINILRVEKNNIEEKIRKLIQ